jgi:hypothetical protein
MAWQVDTFNGYPGPTSDFDPHDRKTDWDAYATIENHVEERVARVVVAIGITMEILFFDQH